MRERERGRWLTSPRRVEGGSKQNKRSDVLFSSPQRTFFTSRPRSLNAAVIAVRSPGRLAPATRTTVVDESAPLSMEITGAAAEAAASVGLEIARSLLLLLERAAAGEGSDDEGLATATGAKRVRGALTAAAREEGGEGSRPAAAAAQEEEGPRRSMEVFRWGEQRETRGKK